MSKAGMHDSSENTEGPPSETFEKRPGGRLSTSIRECWNLHSNPATHGCKKAQQSFSILQIIIFRLDSSFYNFNNSLDRYS